MIKQRIEKEINGPVVGWQFSLFASLGSCKGQVVAKAITAGEKDDPTTIYTWLSNI